MKVKNYLNEWLSEQKGHIKQQTFARYAEIIKNNLVPALGETELNNLTPKQVKAFIVKLGENHADNKDKEKEIKYLDESVKALKKHAEPADNERRYDLMLRLKRRIEK